MDSELIMFAGSFYIPKVNRGDDAHFFCNEAQVIGVADGVGGWWRQGIDPGKYARQLMNNAKIFVKNSQTTDPKSILIKAFQRTRFPGASTACIMSLVGNCLRAANVGDSGFMVMRGGTTIFRSPVQQYEFNHPYQLGRTSDGPTVAEEMAVNLESGDIVVAATDGLFDNLFDEEIEWTVARCMEEKGTPKMIARILAKTAHRKSLKTEADTPFGRAAGGKWSGGKHDDTTVVVAYITKDSTFAYRELEETFDSSFLEVMDEHIADEDLLSLKKHSVTNLDLD